MITLEKNVDLYEAVPKMDEMEQYLLLRSAIRNLQTACKATWRSNEEKAVAQKLMNELQKDFRIIQKVQAENRLEREKRLAK